MASGSVGSSEEDEALKRALELSRRECIYISDNDEELNRAIALSLEQTGPAGSAAVAPSFPTANNDSAVVVSDDEYDEMCANNISLKEKLSKSSLGSGGEEGDNSVRIVTPRKLNGEKANLPELSSDLLKKKEVSQVCSFPFARNQGCGTGPFGDRIRILQIRIKKTDLGPACKKADFFPVLTSCSCTHLESIQACKVIHIRFLQIFKC